LFGASKSSHPAKATFASRRPPSSKKVTYLGWELKVVEVDGVSDAVQIRPKKPAEDGFVEVVLRRGNHLSLERKGAPLHISKGDFERLIRDLKEIF